MTPDAGVEIFAVMRMMMRRIFVADFRSAAPRSLTGVDISGVPVTTGDAEVFGRKSDGFAGFDDAMLDDVFESASMLGFRTVAHEHLGETNMVVHVGERKIREFTFTILNENETVVVVA